MSRIINNLVTIIERILSQILICHRIMTAEIVIETIMIIAVESVRMIVVLVWLTIGREMRQMMMWLTMRMNVKMRI